MSGTRAVVIAVIAVAASLVVAASRVLLRDPQPAVAATGDSRPGDDLVAAERRFRAMISVQFHAARARDLVPRDVDPTKLDIMPLGEAIDLLIEDSVANPLGRSRRRRAIALLAGSSDLGHGESTASWSRLIARAPTFETIRARLLSETVIDPDKRSGIVYAMLGELPVGGNESEHAEISLSIPGCGPKSLEPEGSYLKAGMATTGVRTTVTIPAAEARKRLDPQEWDRFNRFFFPPERTFLVPKPQPTSVVPCAEFDSLVPPAADTAAPAGSHYQDRYLYEHASCPGCDLFRFKTLLKVEAHPGAAPCAVVTPATWCTCPGCTIDYQSCYSLEAPLSACVKGETPILTADEGHLSACRIAPSETEVVTRKKISFEKHSASITAFFGSYLGEKEIRESVAEQLCCSAPGCAK